MRKILYKTGLGAAMLGMLAMLGPAAAQQTYPQRSIRLIVPYAAGGAGDTLARVLAMRLSEQLRQQVVVDNKAGASQMIGAETAAQAAPDGYTLFLGSSTSMVLNVGTQKSLRYKPLEDFSAISMVTNNPLYLAVNRNVPAHNVKELVALAKTSPGKLRYGSIGTGSSYHLAGELFNSLAGVDTQHIPYKGEAPASTDLAAGRIDMIFGGYPGLIPHIKAGAIRVLAVSSKERLPFMQDIPTLAEAGVPGYEAMFWFGVFAPKGVPKNILDQLATQIREVTESQSYRDYCKSVGLIPTSDTPEEFTHVLRDDLNKWVKVMKDAGVSLQ